MRKTLSPARYALFVLAGTAQAQTPALSPEGGDLSGFRPCYEAAIDERPEAEIACANLENPAPLLLARSIVQTNRSIALAKESITRKRADPACKIGTECFSNVQKMEFMQGSLERSLKGLHAQAKARGLEK